MISIKGSILRTRLALVEELAPGDGPKRVLARLTGQERDVLSSLLASAWYPFELGQHLDEAIVQELGGGRADFFEKLGEASAEKNLGAGGVHRGFLVPGDPQAFLAKAPADLLLLLQRGAAGLREGGREGGGAHHARRRDLQRARLPHRRGLVPPGARDVRGAGAARRRGGVPREGRRRLPLPAELVVAPARAPDERAREGSGGARLSSGLCGTDKRD